jgi:hypothetical protein
MGVQVSCPAPVLYFKRFKSVARSGQKKLSPAVYLGNFPTRISPEEPLVRASRLWPDRVRISSPLERNAYLRLTCDKLWTNYS